jgi:hypothetical protein
MQMFLIGCLFAVVNMVALRAAGKSQASYDRFIGRRAIASADREAVDQPRAVPGQ